MPTFTNHVETAVAAERVWDYVVGIDRWAPLFPGYQTHLETGEDEFEWHIRGDVGPWSRLVKFHVAVTRWDPPSSVTFAIKGITEPLEGEGVFTIEPVEGGARMGFELSAEATGPTAPMINMLLTTFLSEQSGDFLERLRADAEAWADADADADTNADAGADADAAGSRPAPTAPPAGRGVLLLTVDSPRTVQADRWLREVCVRALLASGATRVTRIEHAAHDQGMRVLLVVEAADLPRLAATAGPDAALWREAPEARISSWDYGRVTQRRRATIMALLAARLRRR